MRTLLTHRVESTNPRGSREGMHVPSPLPATPFPHCPSDQLFKVSRPRSRTTTSETPWEFQTCFLNQRRNGSPRADHSDLGLLHDPWVLHLLAHAFALLSHKFLLEVFLYSQISAQHVAYAQYVFPRWKLTFTT